MTAREFHVNKHIVRQVVIQDLNTRKVCAKVVLKNLNDDQKARRIEVLAEILERLESKPDSLNRVIIGDESWFFANMTLKPSGRVRNGKRHNLQDRRKQARANQNQYNDHFFLFSQVSFVNNLNHLVSR
jgi:hypothetical protein